jgi:hypothetical protein
MVTQPQESRMGQAIADYLDHLGASANASQRANLQRASERFRGMQSKDSIDAELDQTTGLVTRARIERWISIPEMGEGKDVIEVLRRN